MATLEAWGGLECTVTRVGDRFVDQVRRSGHQDRIDDLDRFAGLGIRAIRYPILWERIAPDRPDVCDWSWTDARLARLRALNVRVIGGLVHHGGGPRYTNLLDDDFPGGVARHAAAVAARYPHVRDWTPINEPVTTARFAGLYGIWYPHRSDEASFWRALLNEVDATRLAMKAVRTVNADARLIQTDDLGRTYATLPLADQAAFDNTRRWMGWDLLFGRVTPQHPFWHRLCSYGLGERLRVIADDPCPPDIIGINHYLTSDRFLDHRVQRYPEDRCGGNGHHVYVDLEPVRALEPAPDGITTALRDAWERYGVPIAVTEVHNGCTREEQMRWALEAWNAALAARRAGIDVRAVTAWALLGSHDWDRLLTERGAYEPGLFDLSGGDVRETALAGLWRGLANGAVPDIARAPGWWRRPTRLLHPVTLRPAPSQEHAQAVTEGRPLLIIGAQGPLRRALLDACAARGLMVCAVGDADAGFASDAELDRSDAWAVINAGGVSRDARATAASDAELLARSCAARGVPLVHISTPRVFAGMEPGGWHESTVPRPNDDVGRVERAIEQAILAAADGSLIARVGTVIGDDEEAGFPADVLRALREGRSVAATDEVEAFAYAPALAAALLDAVIDGVAGVRHFVHDQAIGRAEFARRLVTAAGHDPDLIRTVRRTGPVSGVLASEGGPMLGSLDAAIAAMAGAPNGRGPIVLGEALMA